MHGRQLKPIQDKLIVLAHDLPDNYILDFQNYIIYGLDPGSFFKSLYANDLLSATVHSDAFNKWDQIRVFMHLLLNTAPAEAWGNRKRVDYWLKLSNEERFEINHRCGLVLTEKEATMDILKDPV